MLAVPLPNKATLTHGVVELLLAAASPRFAGEAEPEALQAWLKALLSRGALPRKGLSVVPLLETLFAAPLTREAVVAAAVEYAVAPNVEIARWLADKLAAPHADRFFGKVRLQDAAAAAAGLAFEDFPDGLMSAASPRVVDGVARAAGRMAAELAARPDPRKVARLGGVVAGLVAFVLEADPSGGPAAVACLRGLRDAVEHPDAHQVAVAAVQAAEGRLGGTGAWADCAAALGMEETDGAVLRWAANPTAHAGDADNGDVAARADRVAAALGRSPSSLRRAVQAGATERLLAKAAARDARAPAAALHVALPLAAAGMTPADRLLTCQTLLRRARFEGPGGLAPAVLAACASLPREDSWADAWASFAAGLGERSFGFELLERVTVIRNSSPPQAVRVSTSPPLLALRLAAWPPSR